MLVSKIANLGNRQLGKLHVCSSKCMQQLISRRIHVQHVHAHHLPPGVGSMLPTKSFSLHDESSMIQSVRIRMLSSKIYDGEETNKTISEKEQERIKVELASHTGTDEVHQAMLNEIQGCIDRMNSIVPHLGDIYDIEGLSPSYLHESKKIITSHSQFVPQCLDEMKKIAMLEWQLGKLDDALILQKTILHIQMDYYSKKETIEPTAESIKGEDKANAQVEGGLPENMHVAQSLHAIGSIQSRLNETEDAKKWFDASLLMKQRILCDELGYEHHYQLGKTYNGLAINALKMLEDEDGGISNDSIVNLIRMFESALNHFVYHGEKKGDNNDAVNDERESQLGCTNLEDGYTGNSMADHPHVAVINENMAMLYRQHGDFSMALQKYKESLRIELGWITTEELESQGSSRVVDLLMDVGDCCKALDKFEQGLEAYEEALRLHLLVIRRMRKEAIDNNQNYTHNHVSPMEGILRHNIGHMHAQMGRQKLAMEEYQTSLKIKKAIGESNPEVALTLNAIGALKASLSEYESALAYFNEALYIYQMQSLPFGLDGDADENIVQTKKNIELVGKQIGRNFPREIK